MYLLFYWFAKLKGWKFDESIPFSDYNQSVIISAPHTSNWDFIYAMACFHYLKVPIRFTIKKEWMRFPMSLLMKPLGGVPIDRSKTKGTSKKESTTQAFIKLFEEQEGKDFCVLFTAEGTRKRVEKWKSGFYYAAKGSDKPIALSYLDYTKKVGGIGKIVHLTDNMEEDMRSIMDFYKTVDPKFPENFALDQRYA